MSPERLAAIQSQGTGVGIRGMRERVRQLGGWLQIRSRPTGTTIIVTLSLKESAGDDNRSQASGSG